MSSKYSDSRRRDSHRRDSSPHSRRDSRRSSPGPSRSSPPPPRNERDLPEQFGRVQEDVPDDDTNVIQRMKHSFNTSPLGALYKCINGSHRLRVWTRNYKEVRGICTGFVVAFDKHWNIIMTDVHEVYLRRRRGKTPYLSDLTAGENLPELPPKAPKAKKGSGDKDTGDTEIKEEPSSPVIEPEKATEEGKKAGEKKKKRKKKKAGAESKQRELKQCFIRGDNVVMVAVVKEETN